jgi:uncharacterized membrane protein
MTRLKKWSHDKFRAVTKELAKIRRKMKELEMLGPTAHHTELNVLRIQMDELLYKEEMMLLQRLQIAWLKGD